MYTNSLSLIVAAHLFIFIVGTILGSFLSVIIHRTRHKLSGTIIGRSMCPDCKHKLTPLDLVPVASYLLLRGKCRHCKKKIALKYLFLETITGLLLTGLFSKFIVTLNDPIQFTFFSILSLLFILILFYDHQYQEIPTQFSIPLGVLGACGGYFILHLPILYLILGGAIGFSFFYIQYFVSKGRWVGLGDADLALAIGITVGPSDLASTLFTGYIIGSIVSIYLLASKKAQTGSHIALGPFLIVGFYITLFYGTTLKNLILGF